MPRTSHWFATPLVIAALIGAVVGAGVTLAPSRANAAKVHDIPVPGRVQKQRPGLYASRMGFRRTVAYYRRWLKARGLKHEAVPVYRYRGTLVARFLSQETASRWSAIHVWHYAGHTWITIVPALTHGAARGKSSPPSPN